VDCSSDDDKFGEKQKDSDDDDDDDDEEDEDEDADDDSDDECRQTSPREKSDDFQQLKVQQPQDTTSRTIALTDEEQQSAYVAAQQLYLEQASCFIAVIK